MTITETVLVFVAVPFAVSGILALLIFGAGARRAPRYRPGRPFSFAPVWFLAAPPHRDVDEGRAALPPGADRPSLAADTPVAARHTTAEEPATATRTATRKGGARGTW